MSTVHKAEVRATRSIDPLEARRNYAGPALFSYGFRPFFLLAAVWAALALPLWIYAFTVGKGEIGGLPALTWHVHEMIFGVIGAIIAGFLLTAVPNWTGRLPVLGWRLMVMVGLWAAGRAAMLFYTAPGFTAAAIDSLFLIALAFVMAREVTIGRSWKNVPVVALASLLALANVCFHLSILVTGTTRLSQSAAIAVIIMLISLIGGRIIPSFTRNWMVQTGRTSLAPAMGTVDKIALVSGGVALISWIVMPLGNATGVLMFLAAILYAVRLSRWRGWRTVSEPLLLVLHLGYAWLPLSFALMGGAILWPGLVPASAAVHGLTAGAMGTMTLAVMTRASLGHTGRARVADGWTVLIYSLVYTGALVRVFGPLALPLHTVVVLSCAAILWSGAYLFFALRYGPMLMSMRKA
jgi:uncharacterized protein involved in response to NO